MSNSSAGRLWSRALADVLISSLNADAKMKRLSAKLDETIELRCLDTPAGTDVVARYRIRRGRTELALWREERAGAAFRSDPFDKRELMARTAAPYPIWVKLDKGEMNVIDAILSPEYCFEGAKLRVLRNIRVFVRVNELSAKLNKSY